MANQDDDERILDRAKLQEILDLLVAAGYFRARIKGLSSFDKIVGGMTWAIEMCNVDIDVDLRFQESLTIGQKIALTENIVDVLQKMECPHRLEPHQVSVQTIDCASIFPVIQWLVKKSLEFRQQMGQYIKNYAIGQYKKQHHEPKDRDDEPIAAAPTTTSSTTGDITVDPDRPRRQFRHPKKQSITEEKQHVKTTLLEYGWLPADYHGAGPGQEAASGHGTEADPNQAEAEMEKLDQGTNESPSRKRQVSVSLVGEIVGDKAGEIAALAQEYARQQQDLAESSLEGRERSLRFKVDEITRRLDQTIESGVTVKERRDKLKEEYRAILEAIEEMDTAALNESESDKQARRQYLSEIDQAKKAKQELRQRCREQKAKFDQELEQLRSLDTNTSASESEDEAGQLAEQLAQARKKVEKVRQQLAKRNKVVASFQRKMDDVPGRSELNQYQKRFVELYDQVAAKHIETKKFYMLHNQCDDTRLQLEMELKLLNTILDNFVIANSNTSAREPFIEQFEQIVASLVSTRQRVEARRHNEKQKFDSLNKTQLELIEKQRQYFNCLKQFTQECTTNQKLLATLNQ